MELRWLLKLEQSSGRRSRRRYLAWVVWQSRASAVVEIVEIVEDSSAVGCSYCTVDTTDGNWAELHSLDCYTDCNLAGHHIEDTLRIAVADCSIGCIAGRKRRMVGIADQVEMIEHLAGMKRLPVRRSYVGFVVVHLSSNFVVFV